MELPTRRTPPPKWPSADRAGVLSFRGSGPCILFAVVESTRWARQTDSGPGPPKEVKTAKKSNGRRAFLFEKRESPNSCLGPFVKSLRGARICKDGPNRKKEGALFWTP